MIALTLQVFRQVFRSRFIYVFFIVCAALHWGALQLVMRLRERIPGELNVGPILADHHHLFVSVFVQLFCGTLLAAIFGIWMVPYLHQGARSRLIATLPVRKWKFVFVYGLVFFVLVIALDGIMLAVFKTVSGDLPREPAVIPMAMPAIIWNNVVSCLLLEALAFETLMMAFAVGSLVVGQMPTFLLGAGVIAMTQVLGTLFRLTTVGQNEDGPSAIRRWYDRLPPFGELSFDLWKQYKKPDWSSAHFEVWSAWLLLFAVLLLLRLMRPVSPRPMES
jgi:hypothetical protein